jgi:hypothetical protein
MVEHASFTFTTPLTVNLVEIKGEEHLFVEGDISTNDIDLVNDIMTKECQESMQKQIMERSMKLDIEHEAFQGNSHEEREINKTKIPAGKLIDATVKDLGEKRYSTRVKGEINRHNPRYKEIKGNLLENYLDAFSVAFLPTDIKWTEKNGEKIRLLNDVKLLNVALTGNPCNTKAQLVDIFTKSMDAVEEYKRLKEVDPTIEKNLIVKNADKKESPFSFIFNKIFSGQALDSKEQKLLKASLDVANNQGTYGQLAKEIYEKINKGEKLSYKELYVFRDLLEVDYPAQELQATLMSNKNLKSHSSDIVGDKQLNLKHISKMTDKDNQDPADAGEGQSDEAEQKAMLKSVQAEMKAISEKMGVVEKENETLKDSVSKIAVALEKITKALEQPIHKSPGVQPTDAATKAKPNADAEKKSRDPLSLFG